MKSLVSCSLVLVFAFSFTFIAAADDAPCESGEQLARLPSVADVAPANATAIIGLNHCERAIVRLRRLANEIWNWNDFDDYDVADELNKAFGPAVLNLDGPLTVFELPGRPSSATPRYQIHYYGGSWIVQDKAIAAQSVRMPCGITDRQVFDGHTDIWYLGDSPMAFDGDRVILGYEYPRGNDAVEQTLAAQTLAEEMTPEESARLDTADLVGVLGRSEHLDYFWNNSLPPAPDEEAEELTEEQHVQQQIRQLADNIQWLTAAISIQFENGETEAPTGESYQVSAFFDHAADSETASLLTNLSSPDRPATLDGLPQGDPLLIFAGAFSGEDNLPYYRQLAEIGQRYWNRRNRLQDSLSARQFYGIFEEVGEHMHGFRLAAYRNPDPSAPGIYSVVLIADADDPTAFVAELQQMMRLARADEIATGEEAVTDAEIEALVRSLGDRLYRVRRDATNRLLVIGTRARPFLEAALEDQSLELRTRARVILDHFATLQTDEARHFFGSDLLQNLDPDFRYVIGGETLTDGTPVDWISVTVPEESQPWVQRLEAWFGPEWNRWRVVQTEDHVAICISSRPELLDETLANLREPDTAPQLQVAEWNPAGTAYQFLLHFDAYEFVPERTYRPSKLEEGQDPGLTSLGLNITPTALLVDAHAPLTQLRRMGYFFL